MQGTLFKAGQKCEVSTRFCASSRNVKLAFEVVYDALVINNVHNDFIKQLNRVKI